MVAPLGDLRCLPRVTNRPLRQMLVGYRDVVMRRTATSRDVRAGCSVCHGADAHWYGGNAQGVAARHHDATGHVTWCDVDLSIRYGEEAPDPRQSDIEDAITGRAAQ